MATANKKPAAKKSPAMAGAKRGKNICPKCGKPASQCKCPMRRARKMRGG